MKSLAKFFFYFLCFLSVFCLSAYEAFYAEMEPGEYGVVFNILPRWARGGLADCVLLPGERRLIFPWQRLHRVDGSIGTVEWSGSALGDGEADMVDGFIEARTLDANELGIAVTVQYHVSPARASYVLQRIGVARIPQLLRATAASRIRASVAALKASDFANASKLQVAIRHAREAMDKFLRPEGIVVEALLYRGHEFRRIASDGAVDRDYQELLDKTRLKKQEIEKEGKRKAALIAQKRREKNEAVAKKNRLLQNARGYERRKKFAGDAYLLAKKNEALQYSAVGMSEVEGLREKIKAMEGAGGRALLQLEIAKTLAERDAKYLVLNPGTSGGALSATRLDVNKLFEQAGLFSPLVELDGGGN